MAESTLSVQLSDLASRVGEYCGFGATATLWTGWDDKNPYVPKQATIGPLTVGAQDTQLGKVMSYIQSGLRSFYYPPLTEQTSVAYEWSFMTPNVQITTAVNVGVYNLPDDFRDLVGEFTYQPTDSTWLTVKETGIGTLDRALQIQQSTQSKPTLCAVYPKQTDGTQGQRWAISFAPLPDGVYTLTGRYSVYPNALSATNPFPYGGSAHAETIIESCLAVAETRLNDEQSVHRALFGERLKASIALDREFRPAYLGYNGDDSDQREGLRGLAPWGAYGTVTTSATFNGQVPDSF